MTVWIRLMERSLGLWLLVTFVFLGFVAVMVWRAAFQISMLRKRLEEMQRRRVARPQETGAPLESEALFDDWVPRR